MNCQKHKAAIESLSGLIRRPATQGKSGEPMVLTVVWPPDETDFPANLFSGRVEQAKSLLLNPNYQVIEIAAELGFESIQEFNLAFTRVIGEPPHVYRARLPARSGRAD